MPATRPHLIGNEKKNEQTLHCRFRLIDFAEALSFTNRIGQLAEEADHQPRLVTEWGRVIVTWWSHHEGGMVGADIAMARKVDAL